MSEYADQVRRKDRQVIVTAALKEFLGQAVSCSIAIEKEGYPLIHVTFFEYDEYNHEILFHFSRHGHAGQEITDGKKACVSVYKYGKFYTAPKAVDFGGEYQSVIIYGTVSIIENEEERMQAMDIFFNKFFKHIPKEDYEEFTSDQAKPIYVAKIKIEDWLMKVHRVPDHAIHSFYPEVNATL